MNVYPYLAIGLSAVLVGAGPGKKLFGSNTGGVLVAVLGLCCINPQVIDFIE